MTREIVNPLQTRFSRIFRRVGFKGWEDNNAIIKGSSFSRFDNDSRINSEWNNIENYPDCHDSSYGIRLIIDGDAKDGN